MKRLNKNFTKKICGGGTILALSSIFLFSIGFSSWIYNGNGVLNLNSDTTFGDVVDLNNFFSTPEINSFSVCPTGIVNDETISNKGEISLTTNLVLKNGVLLHFKDIINTLNLKIEIINNGSFNFFDAKFMGSLNPPIKYSFYKLGETPVYENAVSSINQNTINANISYTNNALQDIDTISISCVYSFDFSNYMNDFENEIFNKLGDNPLSFDLCMEVIS